MCSRIWNNEREEVAKLCMQAYYNWHDWFTAQDDHVSENTQNYQTCWISPNEGWVKCIVDAGVQRTWAGAFEITLVDSLLYV